MEPMPERDQQFHEAMVEVYQRARKECGYTATAFLRMVLDHGGVEAARRLLSTDEAQSGLYELWNCGKPEISVEYLVLQPQWRDLFASEQRRRARQRLIDLGFDQVALPVE